LHMILMAEHPPQRNYDRSAAEKLLVVQKIRRLSEHRVSVHLSENDYLNDWGAMMGHHFGFECSVPELSKTNSKDSCYAPDRPRN
jgi:hypothetical protein